MKPQLLSAESLPNGRYAIRVGFADSIRWTILDRDAALKLIEELKRPEAPVD